MPKILNADFIQKQRNVMTKNETKKQIAYICVLVTCCHVTKYPKTQWLKPTLQYSLSQFCVFWVQQGGSHFESLIGFN